MTIFLSDAPRRMLQAAAPARDTLLGRPVPPIRAARQTRKRSRDVPPAMDLNALDG